MDYIRRFFLALVLVVISILFITIYQDNIHASIYLFKNSAVCWSASKTEVPHQSNQRVKLVLFYTPWFGSIPWPTSGLQSNWNLTQDDGEQCSHNCLITYNKCDLAHSDAVIFHADDSPSARVLRTVASWHRNERQRWIYFTHENPCNVPDTAPYNGIFNWTITYRRDSDVFIPYGHYRKIQSNEIPKDHFGTNYAKRKDKLIAWAVSNCGRLRDKVVLKLLEFVQVTVFGRCSKLFNQNPNLNKCKRGSEQCSSLLKTFKFYLAFENEVCFDYITEKYWSTPFDNNMVPIVLGSDYDPPVAIPGSFINILDFPSMEAFANYIKYLDENDTAYNQYFEWKTKYKRGGTGYNSWTCELCANLHNDTLPKKVYNNFGAFWGRESSCNRNYAKIKRLID